MLLFTANQLVAHAIGDYLLQSDWMALKKRTSAFVALVHALTYSLPFLVLTDASWWAMLVIVSTHAVIDHLGLARFVVYAKNFLAPAHIERVVEVPCVACNEDGHPVEYVENRSRWLRVEPWVECSATGYHKDRPPWLAVWLTIIADNTLHVICNAAAIQWL
jgi:hypothetical protein